MAAILDFQSEQFFTFSDLQITPKLPTQVRTTWPFDSGEEVKNRFFPWLSWISDRNNFTFFFFINKSPQCFQPSFQSIGLLVQEKKRKIDFQDGHHGGNLGFPIGNILAISDLQVTLMILTKFQVNWPFGSGEVKNRFSRWPHGYLEFPIGMIIAFFDLQVTPMLPTKFQVN